MSVVAISLLRAKAELLRGSASLTDRLAGEAWADYVRHSGRSRQIWDEHGALLHAIARLEQTTPDPGSAKP